VWWHVYPLGFAGADTTGLVRQPSHAFVRITGWLDYAIRLGASGLALGPIFSSETHGYDTVDHLRLDDRLGDDDDFDALVSEAKGRGMRLLLDGVFNHVARTFARGDDGWLRGTDFEGHGALVELDHSNPAVVDYTIEVMSHWLERGADGWRLDAAYAVDAGFWAPVLVEVRRRHPDAWFVGEMIHGDYTGYVSRSGLDSITQYELWKAIWSSLVDGNLFELAWALKRHSSFMDEFVPMTFVGNHDVTRLATRLGDRRLIGAAVAVMCTVGGVPCVYYGDEHAFEGVKEDRAGGDDAVRPEFPSDEGQLLGADVYRMHQDLIGFRRRHPWLSRARSEVVEVANRRLVFESFDGEGRIRVAIDLDRDPAFEVSERA
jgi:cyclomaltodextrinase